MGDVDISAEAISLKISMLDRDGDEYGLTPMLRALSARITALESLNATRNQQNAAAFEEVDRLREALKWISSDGDYTRPEDMKRRARAALAPQVKQATDSGEQK